MKMTMQVKVPKFLMNLCEHNIYFIEYIIPMLRSLLKNPKITLLPLTPVALTHP